MATTPLITPDDLKVFDSNIDSAKAAALIKYVTAEAKRLAPCLVSITDEDQLDSVRAILVRAALRWSDQGSGALQQWTNTDGPFTRSATQDTRGGPSYSIFYPSEKADLQSFCTDSGRRKRATSRWLL